jgi:outer membrane protein OmpA-like peptidoglycan-associated protein/ABC-type nitrate/sulfonate/bicarbonate transport system substrate-binding protein
MEPLTPLSKLLVLAIAAGASVTAYRTYGGSAGAAAVPVAVVDVKPVATAKPAVPPKAAKPLDGRPIRVAISQWPGHMPMVIAAGGLKTQAGSPAAAEGLDLEIVFIEDAPSKNKALNEGDVDFVWQTVDELPINLGALKAGNTEVRAFLQIDWSRGGDACVASKEVQKIEDVVGRKSGVLMFSPDHTVLEFMLTNSRLTEQQVRDARKNTMFSMDDFTYARHLFEKKEIDIACLWEPDVTLALASRPGAHRLFSTADATELVADVLVTKKSLLDEHPEIAEKMARAWFAAVQKAEKDRPAAARLISTAASRFRDELGYERTLLALSWAKWTNLTDNVRFFGLDGSSPAFDRVYNQADGIWVNYPEAEIKERYVPSSLRDSRTVEKMWVASGKPTAARTEQFDPDIARLGTPVFAKPVSINFASASDVLDAPALAIINQQLLPQLLIAGGMYARIEGNTDSVGDRGQNQVLSEHRASAIVQYLVSRGVSPLRLVARGNGPFAPVATNATPEGRAANRRTDALFIRGPKT